MTVRNTYTLSFSVRRLAELLDEAGFTGVWSNEKIRGGLIQFVSTPADDDVYLEWARGFGSPWERVTGKEGVPKEVVTAPTGQYL